MGVEGGGGGGRGGGVYISISVLDWIRTNFGDSIYPLLLQNPPVQSEPFQAEGYHALGLAFPHQGK